MLTSHQKMAGYGQGWRGGGGGGGETERDTEENDETEARYHLIRKEQVTVRARED